MVNVKLLSTKHKSKRKMKYLWYLNSQVSGDVTGRVTTTIDVKNSDCNKQQQQSMCEELQLRVCGGVEP